MPHTQTDFGCTGQHSYTYINLLDYGARWYSSSLRRFTQPDTLIPDLTDTQSWNRYSYVNNSPILYNDPSGHRYCDWDPDIGECYEDPIYPDVDWHPLDTTSVYDYDPTKQDKPQYTEEIILVGDPYFEYSDWFDHYEEQSIDIGIFSCPPHVGTLVKGAASRSFRPFGYLGWFVPNENIYQANARYVAVLQDYQVCLVSDDGEIVSIVESGTIPLDVYQQNEDTWFKNHTVRYSSGPLFGGADYDGPAPPLWP